jgi:hypothetical protein
MWSCQKRRSFEVSQRLGNPVFVFGTPSQDRGASHSALVGNVTLYVIFAQAMVLHEDELRQPPVNDLLPSKFRRPFYSEV